MPYLNHDDNLDHCEDLLIWLWYHMVNRRDRNIDRISHHQRSLQRAVWTRKRDRWLEVVDTNRRRSY